MAPEDVLSVLDRPQVVRQPPRAVPTGSLGLDLALGGGFPSGRVTELYGNPGSGKSALAYHAAARAQETGTVVWMDSGGFDRRAAERAGVKLNELAISHPDNVTYALCVFRFAALSCSLMVLDSATGLDDGSGYETALGMLTGYIRADGPAVLITSDKRVSEMATGGFSSLLRQVAPVQVRLTREGPLTTATVIQNRAVPPAANQARFSIKDGCIDSTHELVLLALDCGVLHKRGSWVYFKSVRLAQGVASTANLLGDWPRAVSEIQEAVVDQLTTPTREIPCPQA